MLRSYFSSVRQFGGDGTLKACKKVIYIFDDCEGMSRLTLAAKIRQEHHTPHHQNQLSTILQEPNPDHQNITPENWILWLTHTQSVWN